MSVYDIEQLTTETYAAICKKCKKTFRSDKKHKVIERVTNHYRDKHAT